MEDYPQIDLTAWHPTGQGTVLRYEFQKSSLPERLFFAVHIRRLICKF